MITTEGGDVVVPTDVLKEVWILRTSACLGMKDIVDRLRIKTVPYGYTYSSWIPGVHL